MISLVWREQALSDLEAMHSHIGQHNPAAADRLQEIIKACAERLPDHPFMYRPGRIAGTREAVVHPNYILVYRVTAEAVEVVNMVHARQQYP